MEKENTENVENSETTESAGEIENEEPKENVDITDENVNNEAELPNLNYDFTKQPIKVSETDLNSVFTKGCKFSPDGLCVLLCTDDQKLRIYDLPPDFDDKTIENTVTVQEGENVYDFQWYPLMNSQDVDSCCFATTSRFQPIHLYDAFDGHIRATYRCFDHLDEMVAARSINFDPSGHKLIAGLKNQIRIFDVNVPGRDCQTIQTFTKNDGGLSGIISSIAFNPAMNEVFALASYSTDMAVYLDPRAQLLCVLEGQKGGITHIKFTPDGTKLLAGSRKDDDILVWDMRNPGQLFAKLHRKVDTNQRIYFDISSDGKYVLSGGTNGTIYAWNLDEYGREVSAFAKMHEDCINGLDLHPYSPLLATCSGQRHIETCQDMLEDSDAEEDVIDNSLKLWKLETLTINDEED